MKNNIEFYYHMVTADQHPKFSMLRVKYGWAGEGQFWALNNRIGQAEGCVLDISKKYNKASIADALGFNMEEFDEFIQYLLEECELIIEVEPGKITTDMIQEIYSKVMSDREASRNRKKRNNPPKNSGSPGKGKSSPEPPPGNDESSPEPDNKLKKTKLKKTKEKLTGPSDLLEHFGLIEDACRKLDGLISKNKYFNPRKWAVEQLNNRGHPGAIVASLDGIRKCWHLVDKPYGYVNQIMKIQNGNFNEADAIKHHESFKKTDPQLLNQFTQGLFRRVS